MIKIGVTAFRRPELLTECVEKIKEFTDHEYELMVACDSPQIADYCKEKGYPFIGGERRGVARNKNRLIRWFQFSPVKHFFIFEDDTYPIQKGWDTWFIKAHEQTGFPIFLFMSEDKMWGDIKQFIEFQDYTVKLMELDSAMMMSLQPHVIETLGGMNQEFRYYGGEHSEFLQRAVRVKMLPVRGISLKGCDKYIWSKDIDNFYASKKNPVLERLHELQKQSKIGLEIFDRTNKVSKIYQEPVIEI